MRDIRHSKGFTLIEVLVALVVMSIMALLSWQGIEGISRASHLHRERSQELATVQTALSQWKTDLDQMIDAAAPPAGAPSNAHGGLKSIDFDGRVLRITRRFASESKSGLSSAQEWRVVAWGIRTLDGGALAQKTASKRFMRWVSEPIQTRADWQAAWSSAARWGQNPTAAEIAKEVNVLGIDDWKIFYYREDGWSHPQSSTGAAQNNNPDGIRLILQLAPDQQPGGSLSIDWVQPTRGGGRG